MFKKVLVGSRGEMASRMIRAGRELDIPCAAIYAEGDATSLYVKKANESYMVGPGPVEGFLNIHRIVDLALKIKADAIHPGYGFLSENPKLPELCEKKGITFIGPTSEAISLMGDKIAGKESVRKAGVPVLPGSVGSVGSDEEAVAIARETGYPVM